MTRRTSANATTQQALRLLAVAAVAALALCLLGSLVAHGVFTASDQYAVRHLMPFADSPASGTSSALGKLFAWPSRGLEPGSALRLPASAGFSALLVAVLAALLWRKRRRALALFLVLAFGIENLAEGFGKLVVTKPTLFQLVDGALQPAGFPHSFPSGHVARAALLAALASAVWPRLWPLFWSWFVAVVVSAELDGIHTPSDILGGLLLACAVVAGAFALAELWALAGVPSRRVVRARPELPSRVRR
jgi:membrane-associated phospholipid phosphatase